jgi:glycosyltransferase involved in cell wall biosynthesis
MVPRDRQQRVTFVADELLGYAGNGIGTTTTFVSLALARSGYHVEILFAGHRRSGTSDMDWKRLYDDAGVRVHEVPVGDQKVEPPQFARGCDVDAVLRADPPDVVIVQDLGAPAYASLRLRRLGLAFEHTFFVVFCHGTRQWIADVSRKVRVLPGAHAVSLLERSSVELADAVVSPSAYLVDWMRGERWRLPQQTFVIPHVSRAGATGEAPTVEAPATAAGVERLAFFGRLEERKGVRPFAAALNALEPELLARVDVEFLGRPTPPLPVEGVQALLTDRTRAALRGLSFETELDQHEALARLGRPGTLAIVPSFEENSPNTIYECLENHIPFIASDVAGIRELVARDDRARVLFDPTADGIAAALRHALANGEALRPVRAAFDDAESLRRWDHVLALPDHAPPPTTDAPDEIGPDWLLLLDEGDAPDPALVETLVRAQRVSGADVVTCGISIDGTAHLFHGEPGALGLLGNGYGTVALVRRVLLDPPASEPRWPLFAQLSLAGARIVSIPMPLVSSGRPPAKLETHRQEALRVLRQFERALPDSHRFLAEFVTRDAAAAAEPAPLAARSVFRRLMRRLLRGVRR